MTMLMKRAMVSLPCFGSGSTERCGVFPLRDIAQFSVWRAWAGRVFSGGGSGARPANRLTRRALGGGLGAGLLALGGAGGVERTRHGGVARGRAVVGGGGAGQAPRELAPGR